MSVGLYASSVNEQQPSSAARTEVMVFGTFDRLHPGHEFVLRRALERGHVTVIVARASNVVRIKGRPPTESDAVRLRALRKRFTEATILLGDPIDFLRPVREHPPEVILLGYDQKLPPGITEADLAPAKIERLPAHEPERFKSSLMPYRTKIAREKHLPVKTGSGTMSR